MTRIINKYIIFTYNIGNYYLYLAKNQVYLHCHYSCAIQVGSKNHTFNLQNQLSQFYFQNLKPAPYPL